MRGKSFSNHYRCSLDTYPQSLEVQHLTIFLQLDFQFFGFDSLHGCLFIDRVNRNRSSSLSHEHEDRLHANTTIRNMASC